MGSRSNSEPPNFRTAKKFSTLIVRIGKKGYGQSFDDAGIPEYSFDHWMFFLKSIFEKFKWKPPQYYYYILQKIKYYSPTVCDSVKMKLFNLVPDDLMSNLGLLKLYVIPSSIPSFRKHLVPIPRSEFCIRFWI